MKRNRASGFIDFRNVPEFFATCSREFPGWKSGIIRKLGAKRSDRTHSIAHRRISCVPCEISQRHAPKTFSTKFFRFSFRYPYFRVPAYLCHSTFPKYWNFQTHGHFYPLTNIRELFSRCASWFLKFSIFLRFLFSFLLQEVISEYPFSTFPKKL